MRKAVHPGDECRLHAGTYEVGPARCELSGVHGAANSPITISSVGDGPVVIDGTVAIPGPWTKRADGLYAAAADHDVFGYTQSPSSEHDALQFLVPQIAPVYGVKNTGLRSIDHGISTHDTDRGHRTASGRCENTSSWWCIVH